jgi:hypothetical protein
LVAGAGTARVRPASGVWWTTVSAAVTSGGARGFSGLSAQWRTTGSRSGSSQSMQTYRCRPCPSSAGTSFMARPQRGHGFRIWKTVFIGLPLLAGSLVGFDRPAQADFEKLSRRGGRESRRRPLSALRPIRRRSSTDLSPIFAASRSLEATCARAPASHFQAHPLVNRLNLA